MNGTTDTNDAPDSDVLSPWRLLLTLAVVVAVLIALVLVWRSRSGPRICADRGPLVHRRAVMVLADGSRSMGPHVHSVEDSLRAIVEAIGPGDDLQVYQVGERFDDRDSRIMEVVDGPPVRRDLASPSLGDLSPPCRAEAATQLAAVEAQRATWVGRAKLKPAMANQCSGYLTAINALARKRSDDPAVNERWLVVLGDMEAEVLRNSRCGKATPDPAQFSTAKPFQGLRVILAVPDRESPHGGFWQRGRKAWTAYFRAGGTEDVQAMSLEEFRSGAAQRLLAERGTGPAPAALATRP
jgi:hypothetical protein